MTIKYFKYTKSTLPAIKAGMIEVYGESEKHVSKDLLLPYEGLKVGIGFIPKWDGWEQSQFSNCGGFYNSKSKTIWINTTLSKSLIKVINHELLHACQRESDEAKNLIWELAQNSTSWTASSQLVDKLYPIQAREIEYPVWVLQYEQATCDYFIKKYLLK
jgi:hypothetical protein